MKIFLLALITLAHVICNASTVSRPRDPTDDVDGNSFHDVIDSTQNSQQEKKSDDQGPRNVMRGPSVGDLIQRNKADTSSSEESSKILEVINGSSIESGNIVDDVLSKFKNFDKPNKGEEWSGATFKRALKDLGVFELKGVEVVKMKSDEIEELKKSKGGIKVVKATTPRRKTNITKTVNADEPSDQNAHLVKRTNGYDLCTEYVDSMYVLAHSNSQYAYKVESVRCEGTCYSATYNVQFGTCNLATKSMTVYVINSDGNFVSENISPGCACECLFTNN